MLRPITFAHISDTHIRKSYQDTGMDAIFAAAPSPAENLRRALTCIAAAKPSFLLITGDLIHEGQTEDYALLADILREEIPEIPAVCCLGNHDRKAAFRQGYLKEAPSSEPYLAVTEIDGLRVICLDSAIEGKENGAISESQLDWLARQVQQPAPRGSVLCFHHPVMDEGGMVPGVEVSPRLQQIVKESDIAAIFCGHTHQNSLSLVGGKPQLVADSLAFGFSVDGTGLHFTTQTCYSLVTVSQNGVKSEVHPNTPVAASVADISIQQLQAMMKD